MVNENGDIPESVLMQAELVVIECNNYTNSHSKREAIAKAIFAERSACAKVAADEAEFHRQEASVSVPPDYAFHTSLQRNFAILAERIRRR